MIVSFDNNLTKSLFYFNFTIENKEQNKIMKIKRTESLVLGKMLRKIAPGIGATVFVEPKWGVVGQITFKNGRRSYFRYNTLDLNPMGASDIARDKDYSNLFMERMGYPIVPGSKAFYSDRWAKAIGAKNQDIDAAYRHAVKIGFPVILKPNSGSQGTGVTLVHNKSEFYRAAHGILKSDRVMLVQKPVAGKDYRIVVLDDKVISAYQRIPLSVVGDGKSTIKALLRLKQKNFVASSRDTRIKTDDPRMKDKLKHQGLSFRSIPKRGVRVFLLDNANLSTGGDSIDVTKEIHPAFAKVAIALTKDMGLRLCGVDLMIGGDIKEFLPKNYWVLEINSAPGLDHYAKIGRNQEKVVENLYLQVLEHLGR
ncbi:MAG: cyanophycin synthetase [Candidatus Pacebacteria bacterium]|jgi:D-alanine-D-alanine ligase-like ATP-grasp enzyme|nr:cyanophycin synthetase [Candidatus Paceibacterota bacterium]